MEETKYFVIKVGNFYVSDFYVNAEDLNTFFINDIEFTTDKYKANKYELIDDAITFANRLIALGFETAQVSSLLL